MPAPKFKLIQLVPSAPALRKVQLSQARARIVFTIPRSAVSSLKTPVSGLSNSTFTPSSSLETPKFNLIQLCRSALFRRSGFDFSSAKLPRCPAAPQDSSLGPQAFWFRGSAEWAPSEASSSPCSPQTSSSSDASSGAKSAASVIDPTKPRRQRPPSTAKSASVCSAAPPSPTSRSQSPRPSPSPTQRPPPSSSPTSPRWTTSTSASAATAASSSAPR